MDLLLFLGIAVLAYLLARRRRDLPSPRPSAVHLRRQSRSLPADGASPPSRAHPDPMFFRFTRDDDVFEIRRVLMGALNARAGVSADECWVPPGQPITIQKRRIERGMLYVGVGLLAPTGWRQEPALVDPTLTARGGHAGPLGYRPSYDHLTPPQRGRYLDWLAGGARAAGIEPGYVFLYFAGLERRYFIDGAPEAEREAVRAEVRRLRDRYDGGFRASADRLLDAAPPDASRGYDTVPEIKGYHYALPMELKLALGQAAADRAPLPADWALLWLYADDKTPKRTCAQRCVDEIRDLWRLRYAEAFGDGLRLKPNATALTVPYHASAGSFHTDVDLGLADVTRQRGPLKRLRPLFAACTAEMETYSRFVGSHPQKRGTREAIGLMPRALAVEKLRELVDPFASWVQKTLGDAPRAVVDGGTLVQRWTGAKNSHLTRRLSTTRALYKPDAQALSSFLSVLGVGIEPDVRRGGAAPGEGRHAVLFARSEPGPVADASDAYATAEAMLAFLAPVADAAHVPEATRERIVAPLRDGLRLDADEGERLAARLAWLLHATPTFHGLKRVAETALSAEARRATADLALHAATLDGPVSPAVSAVLAKVYRALGLDPEAIYADLHARHADGPTVVRPASGGAAGFALPPPDLRERDAAAPAAFALDMDLVRDRLADTRKASALLAGVFADDDATPTGPDAAPAGADGATEAGRFAGLDAAHAALLSALLERPEWPLAEVEAAAAAQGLMPGGALETLNEWAFDRLGDALLSDGDPILVYLDVWTDSTD